MQSALTRCAGSGPPNRNLLFERLSKDPANVALGSAFADDNLKTAENPIPAYLLLLGDIAGADPVRISTSYRTPVSWAAGRPIRPYLFEPRSRLGFFGIDTCVLSGSEHQEAGYTLLASIQKLNRPSSDRYYVAHLAVIYRVSASETSDLATCHPIAVLGAGIPRRCEPI
ncbi:hypothetical protein JX265_008231 [Neoarthrinium moseri]|uniref:Uncharacterized protein n=1 Tax=Neoarthrinium moseri TaxID=1658444 RepID=A0A9P9WII0_9PEZI|nr:uncharacterized protein JN550_004930 [Neoarthrinium moseri]KAI1865184.1 hypothetical protein JX265_008231 [Neoarthrinium moseri]KAI1870784.1 hypothetical protein JN550_004930 [Neoarthrinium moseri]